MYRKVWLALSLIDKRSRILVFVFSLMRVLISGLDTLGVILIGMLLSKSATQILNNSNENNNGFLNFSHYLNDLSVVQIAIFALILFVSKSLLSIIFIKFMTDILADAESKVATKTYIDLLNSKYLNFSNISSQELIFSLNYSASYAITGILNTSVSILSESTLLFAIGLIFILVDSTIAIGIILYFSLIGYLIYRVIGPKMQSLGTRFSKSILASSTSVSDSVMAYRELFTLRKQSEFISKFSNGRKGFAKANSYAAFYGTLPRYIVESALLLGAVILASYIFRDNNATQAVGILGVFLTGSMRMMSSLLPLQNSINSLRYLFAQSDSFFNLIEKTKTERNEYIFSKEIEKRQQKSISVVFDDVTFSYKDAELAAVKNVSFKIEPGEYVALIGPSGSGKSTIADLLIKLIEPDSGSVNYLNIELAQARIGYVPQSPGIVSGTILENITLNVESKSFDKERLDMSLKQSHLVELINSLKDGINTDLGANSDGLSGGQLQRIGLARALYSNPGLLVLDEATSALDAETESIITESLNELKGHCSIVVIAHRLSTVQNADRVYVIDSGQIVASGKFSELAKSNELVARYVELSQINID